METYNFGEFGELTIEDAKKAMMLEKDYRQKTAQVAERQRSLDTMTQQAQEAQQVIDLIDRLGVGEQVVELINGAASGSTRQGPQFGEGDSNPDPYVLDLESRLEQAMQRIDQVENGFYGRWVQDDLRDFKATHPDLTDEDIGTIGEFMVQENLPNLDYAYRLNRFDEMMEKAREDGEGRVKQQLEAGRLSEGIISPPLLAGGQGGPIDAPTSKPTSFKAAAKAAYADFLEGDQEP